MSLAAVSRALVPAWLFLSCLVPGALAESLPTQVPTPQAMVGTDADEAGFADQVIDPEEVEDPNLVLEEFHDAAFSTPAQVSAYVQAQLGVAFEPSAESPNLVVVRNAGSGYRPEPKEAAYDDLFLVVTSTKVVQFTHGNAEGTEHRAMVQKYGYNQHVDPNLGMAMTPALAPGPYQFVVGKHQDKYKALRVHALDGARDGLPSQRRNGKRGPFIVGAVNIHKGGSDWIWSVGCLTLHYSRYEEFIALFPMGKWGKLYLIGDWDGEKPRGQELAEGRTGDRLERFGLLAERFGLD